MILHKESKLVMHMYDIRKQTIKSETPRLVTHTDNQRQLAYNYLFNYF
jgi:hypothetical protein